MKPVTRLRARAVEFSSTARRTLIDSYLGTTNHSTRVIHAGIPEDSGLGPMEIELVDASDAPDVLTGAQATSALWHVLWVRDEERAVARVATQPTDIREWPIAPGDTFPIPAGASLRAEGGQLGLVISTPGAELASPAPTHGTERYFGYNRQTVAVHTGKIRLGRWKLTQPLVLAEHHPMPAIVMALARSAVIRTGTTIDQLAQGQAVLIDPAADPVITPDGLAYLLTIDKV